MNHEFDRAAEDLHNIAALEHVNVRVPDQRTATIFYVTGMGFTRDPYLMTGVNNMWINVGRNQFHLPTGEPQVLRGHVGLVLPNREALLGRLAKVKNDLDETRFAFAEEDSYVEVSSPWGNLMRCFEPNPNFGHVTLGMAYVEFDVPVGTSASIAHFYRQILDTKVETDEDEKGCFAICLVGNRQYFIFRETDRPLPAYDDHHVQIYLVNFSNTYEKLKARGLISEESSEWQYRFRDIVDVESGEVMFTIDHEVRSMTHPLFGRWLINRDPERTNRNFAAGQEDLRWSLGYKE